MTPPGRLEMQQREKKYIPLAISPDAALKAIKIIAAKKSFQSFVL
jgi:hypothetical protein